ncbi:MAG TPA: acyl-CoA synthetase [Burkholderiales bacterium]|nr:acyl-CoA synthetase [Burkholderiales bacterium]
MQRQLRKVDAAVAAAPEWIKYPERGSRLAMRLAAWLMLALGRPVARLLLYPICAYFVVFSLRARKASAGYLRRVLGRQPGARDVFRHYHTFASTIQDRVYLLAAKCARLDVSVSAPAPTLELLRRGGCILLGSHLGSFEVLRARAAADGLPPLNPLVYRDNAEKLNSVLRGLDPELESRIIALGSGESLLRVHECLARGELVGMLGDRAWRNERTCSCEFLGAPANFPLGPLLTAGLLGSPMVLFFGLYLGGRRYEMRLEPFADAIVLDARDREASVRPWVERYARRLEHHCRLAPYNWFNFYDFWA